MVRAAIPSLLNTHAPQLMLMHGARSKLQFQPYLQNIRAMPYRASLAPHLVPRPVILVRRNGFEGDFFQGGELTADW
jgi:hypothetical protein